MSVSIRLRLLLLVLLALLPGLVGLSFFIFSTYAAEREANTRTLHDTARALSMVVEAELRRHAAVAQALAGSRWLDAGPNATPEDLRRFQTLARRALNDFDGWIELRSASGVIFDTRQRPAALAVPAAADSDEAFALSELRRVEPLQLGATPDDAFAAVVQPVQRDGHTLLNLAIALRPAELQRIVDAQKLPAGWYGTVLDSHARVVARYPQDAAFVGREATADLRRHLAASDEGLFMSVSLDGKRTVGYYRTTEQGWSYLVAMPRDQFPGLLPRTVPLVALAALALIGLAVGGALWMARRISRPVNALKTAAAQLHAGEPVTYRRTGIIECDAVAGVLASAGERIERGRIELEQQVEQAVQRTQLAEQRASHGQRIEALGRLTGGVAHDFNNLMGVVSNSAHLIQRHPLAAELEQPLGSIHRAVAMGSQLTQHLLRFAGRRPVQPRPIELAAYLPEVRELMRSVLGQHIAVNTRVDSATPAVRVDAAELELALINLALNARDAMPGGGELRLRARPATPEESDGLAGHPRRDYVLITVGDDGSGIEPAVAARAFEPFFTTKAVGKGTGLGLSQVLGFCVQAGGTARLASTPGLGTTVSLLLPAAAREGVAAEHAAEHAAEPAAQATQALHGKRLLLVEDNDELARSTAALLRTHGLQVQCAGSAAQALHKLAPPHDVDLVLSDVVMPGELDGVMLARQLQREQPGLPLVLVSGYSDAAARAADLQVLRKPYGEEQLLRALAKALAMRQRPAPPEPLSGGPPAH